MSQPARLPAPQARLFTPGRRLGWVFRDPRLLAEPFQEPEPRPKPLPPHVPHQRHLADIAYKQQVGLAFKLFGTLSLILLLMSGCTAGIPGAGVAAYVSFLVLAFLAAVLSVLTWWGAEKKRNAAAEVMEEAQQYHTHEHARAHAAWMQRKAEHDHAQAVRLARADEWGSAQAQTTQRLDVFGGGLWGWEALLTVHGASVLAGQPLLVIDLSREIVCGELIDLARASGIRVHSEVLPAQLTESALCEGLDIAQLIDVIVESIHGGENPVATSRSDRSMDHRILTALAAALGDTVTMARLAEGLRVLLDEEPELRALNIHEHDDIAHRLFSQEYRDQIRPALTRIESYLHPIRALGASRAPSTDPATLTCIAIGDTGRGPGAELLTDLIVQWLTHRITTSTGQVPAVIVVSADELARHHLERLSDTCERRHVPLTLLFRHLRETSLGMIGGGAVGFMRLGNHEEATRAADFIGRQHRFVLSSLTRTLGGNQTHTETETTGQSDTAGNSTSGSFAGGGFSSGSNRSVSRNWSSARSFADGTNWSDATAQQRVYEYAVEPTTLQSLPDYALLLAEPGFGRGLRITSADCNPAIVTLPKVSTEPLPDLQVPRPAQPQLPQSPPGMDGMPWMQRPHLRQPRPGQGPAPRGWQ